MYATSFTPKIKPQRRQLFVGHVWLTPSFSDASSITIKDGSAHLNIFLSWNGTNKTDDNPILQVAGSSHTTRIPIFKHYVRHLASMVATMTFVPTYAKTRSCINFQLREFGQLSDKLQQCTFDASPPSSLQSTQTNKQHTSTSSSEPQVFAHVCYKGKVNKSMSRRNRNNVNQNSRGIVGCEKSRHEYPELENRWSGLFYWR